MKKYLFLLAFLFWPLRPAHAVANNIWLSSNTATADTTQVLCGQYVSNNTTSTLHGVLHEVIVSSAVGATTLTIYNSSFTVTGSTIVGPLMTSSLFAYPFDIGAPSGLMYSKTGTAQVQILYQCY